ncbi:MAG: hypothetical protein II661_09005 [Bacteroidales bacterium]|nr:hypothetical protein [Bacteroidales bacterium]
MKTGRQTAKYILWDAFAALVAWAVFFFYRKLSIEHNRFDDVNLVFQDRNFWWGIVLLPIAWCCFYAILGNHPSAHPCSPAGMLKSHKQILCAHW